MTQVPTVRGPVDTADLGPVYMHEEEGVDPRRVVLGHSGDTTDCDHLAELADAGFLLGMDRFGLHLDTTFEARADTLVQMYRRSGDRVIRASHPGPFGRLNI